MSIDEVCPEVFEAAAEKLDERGWERGSLTSEHGACLLGGLGLARGLPTYELGGKKFADGSAGEDMWYDSQLPFVEAMGFDTVSDAYNWNDGLVMTLAIAAVAGDGRSWNELTNCEKIIVNQIVSPSLGGVDLYDEFREQIEEDAKRMVQDRFMETAKDLRNKGVTRDTAESSEATEATEATESEED